MLHTIQRKHGDNTQTHESDKLVAHTHTDRCIGRLGVCGRDAFCSSPECALSNKKNREKKTNKQTTPLALVWEYIVYTINPLGWLLSAMHKYTSQLLIWSSYYLSSIIRVERAIQKLLSHRAEAEAVSGMDICCVVLRSVLCKWKKVPDGRLMNKLYWAWYVGKCWRMRVMKSRRHTYTNRRTKYKKIEAMNFAFNTRLIIIIRFVNVHVHYV